MYKAMKLSDVPGMRAGSQAASDVLDFAKTAYVCGEIVIPTGEKVESVVKNYHSQLRKKGLTDKIQIVRRGNRVFMVKREARERMGAR